MKQWGLIIVGAMCVAPLAAIDPAAALLLFDVEVLAGIGTAGAAFIRGDLRALRERFLSNHTVMMTRSAWRLSIEHPSTLLDA